MASSLRVAALRPLALAIALATAFAFTFAPTPSHADTDDTALTNLISLVSQRLALAEPVARWKWVNHRPVGDAHREAALLADIAKRAPAVGVDPEFARAFFQDQIDASKDIQNALFEQWRKLRPPDGPVPDLDTRTRAQLDRLTQSMISALARVQTLRATPDCPTQVARGVANWKSLTRYDATQTEALTRALGHVCESGGVGATG
ncbi:chorismate mutase [Paraburkholderia solisilvae]|uniref:Chorismate mutase n=1 Tax=Paraburkholderia solisilvae TaxID=624376 RepID=A0A6J5EJJ7_9BURK|nr:chorismate mutase [Paraburkholderia solisilvae]CAB3766403.1 Secreted chorismate mutase [Paraburkholderia solisilvae]